MLIFLSLTFYVVFLLLLAFVKGVGREVQKVGGEIEGVFTIFPIVFFFFGLKLWSRHFLYISLLIFHQHVPLIWVHFYFYVLCIYFTLLYGKFPEWTSFNPIYFSCSSKLIRIFQIKQLDLFSSRSLVGMGLQRIWIRKISHVNLWLFFV